MLMQQKQLVLYTKQAQLFVSFSAAAVYGCNPLDVRSAQIVLQSAQLFCGFFSPEGLLNCYSSRL